VFIMALIRDTYVGVILYASGGTRSCICLLYSFSGYREKKYEYMFVCRQN